MAKTKSLTPEQATRGRKNSRNLDHDHVGGQGPGHQGKITYTKIPNVNTFIAQDILNRNLHAEL